jgi:TonB-dependent SusC/RagA subfamily outer membrane receptor
MIVRTVARILLVLALSFVFLPESLAQSLIQQLQQRPVSKETLLYRLTQQQAEYLTDHHITFGDSSFFNSFVKVINEQDELHSLPFGHYLKVSASGPNLIYDYIPVSPFILYLPDNSTDLLVQIKDRENNTILKDLQLTLDGHLIPFDKASNTYRLAKSNLKGKLDVAYGDRHYYYLIEKTRLSKSSAKTKRSLFRFKAVRIVVGVPYKIVRLPYDGYRSIKKGYAQGSVYWIRSGAVRWYHAAGDIFRSRKNNYFYSRRHEFDNYSFTSKPKYRMHDTVSFKVLLYDGKKKTWCETPLSARLRARNETYFIGTCTPQNASGYYYTFQLNDSMKLQMDHTYTIELFDKDSSVYADCYIRLEDYELQKSVFKIECPDNEQIRDKTFEIKYTAKDENALPMRDAKAEVEITAQEITGVKPDTLFVPYTVWKHEFAIEDGVKTLTIPDSLFADANYQYQVKTTLRNAENERKESSFTVNYLQEKFEIKEELQGDSILIQAFQNDAVISIYANIKAIDRYGYYLSDQSVKLPYKTKLNTHVLTYQVATSRMKKDLQMTNNEAFVSCFADRTGDSVTMAIKNPRKLEFTYQVYQRNKELWRTHASTLDTVFACNEKDIYYVSVQYIWAGSVVSDMYEITLKDKIANLTIDQPQVIYPGKETEITITAKDYKNRPLENMSILTYAYTAKFDDADNPTLPDFSSKQKAKSKLNTFTEGSDFKHNYAINLHYDYWRKHMSVDTMPGFRFIFPDKKIEKIELPAEDSITQFSPFVTDSGRLQAVHYVLVNNVPVYFGFTDNKARYSFEPCTVKYNQIKIRTEGSLIIIDSFVAKEHYKTLFTVDVHRKMDHVTVVPMPDRLTRDEINTYSNYVIRLNEENTTSEFRFISSTNKYGVFKLNNAYNNERYYARNPKNTLGPIYNNNWTYNLLGEYSIEMEVDPGYRYTFRPKYVKMVIADRNEQLIDSNVRSSMPPLDDWIITEAKMLEKYKEKPKEIRRSINYTTNYQGHAQLMIDLKALAQDTLGHAIEPLNIILTQPGNFNFINIYPGSSRYFANLPAGKFDLLIVEENGIYRRVANLNVRDEGFNFYRIKTTDTLPIKSMKHLDSLLNSLYTKPYQEHQNDAQLVMGKYLEATYDGPVQVFTGSVLDNNNEGIPGASIVIKGTQIGTITDVEGRFEINVPVGLLRQGIFRINAFGSQSEEFEMLNGKMYILQPSGVVVDEVTIYGRTETKRERVSSMATVSEQQIASRPVTNIISALDGKVAGISVTSGGGQPGSSPDIMVKGFGSLSAGSNPLIVVDGVIYSGSLASIDAEYIDRMTVLKNDQATAMYGARGANGVIVLTTKKGIKLPDALKAALEEATPLIPEDIMVSGLRSNFKDDAFWHPNLVTDKNGTVSFKVKFPDDLTSWNTFVYATDQQQHVGQASGNIRSFKPVSAALQATQFLVAGDSANFVGKSVNYISDTIRITNSYFINDSLKTKTEIRLSKYNNEILPVTAPLQDSIKLKYLLTKADGYFDGEEKNIIILPKGISVAKGEFLSMDSKDTSITIPPVSSKEPLYINATASLIDIVLDEIEKVKKYEHLCNEQLSSKIIATLNQQKIYNALHKPMPAGHMADVQKMINLLVSRQNAQQLWGWWGDGQSVLWISNHVIRALNMAVEMNYNVGQLNFEKMVQPIVYRWETDTTLTDVQSLKLLQTAGMKLDYEKYIKRIERKKGLTLGEKLEMIRFRQELKLPYSTKTLKDFMQEDIYGNIFWKDTVSYIYENDVLNTLTAFKIIQNDTTVKINKHKVVNWLLQERKVNGWRNIYESSQLIEAIASSIDLTDTNRLKPVLSFSGGLNEEVTTFPFQRKMNVAEAIQVRKTGAAPVYFTWYQRQWDTTNINLGRNFVIRSIFEYKSAEIEKLKAGEPTLLKVKVKVIKSSDFVMIDIPVPAGCSYQNKKGSYSNHEVHREYYRDHVSIFCQQLPKGEYTYTIELLPRYTGKYTLNPAKAELMYFPVFYGREKIKQIDINQ